MSEDHTRPALALWHRIFKHERGLLEIWTGVRGPDGIEQDTIRSQFYNYPDAARTAAEWALEKSAEGREVFFCAHLLTAPRRRKENAAAVCTLWAELDGPEVPNGALTPSEVVESSPGRFHLYWKLTDPIPPDVAEQLNRRLARAIGADPSGADLSQILRVPETLNHKYPDLPRVQVIDTCARTYSLVELDRLLPDLARPRADHDREAASEPPVELDPEARAVWEGKKPKLKDDGQLDRSRTLLKIGRVLYDAKATRTAIVAALEERDVTLGYRKYTDRQDAELRYHEIVDELESSGRNGQVPLVIGNRRGKDEPSFNLTDLGNSERFVREHGKNVRYCYPWRKFLVWAGKRWEPDEVGWVSRLAKRTVRAIYQEAADAEDAERSKALARHALRSESEPKIRAMLELAKSELAVRLDKLDAAPWLLNVENGTIDLRTGELREHRREDLITKIAPVRYDPQAESPTFERFLERILPSEPLRRFVRRVIGYAASGVVSEEVLVILHGTGDNGKTTLMNVILEALGDYAIQAAPDLLVAKRGAHPTELTDLFGARFVACSETDERRRLAEALVKQLTGRERIRARGMRQDFWEFDPTHTICLATNHKPEVRGTDHAIWRRLKLVPFEVKIPEEEKDKKLPEKLRAELPGILAGIVRGCLDYQREGLGEPDEVRRATVAYRNEMDVLAAFIEDRCVVGEGLSAPATPLYKQYQMWCDDAGEERVSQTRFGMRLKERGFENKKITRGPHKDRMGWFGIGLKTDHPDPEDPGSGDDEPSAQSEYQGDTKGRKGDQAGGERDQDAKNAAPRRGVAETPPLDERRIDKPSSAMSAKRAEGSGTNFNISGQKFSHKAYMEKDSAPSAPSANRVVESPVEGLLEDPPEWLSKQLADCRENPERWLKPTSAAIAEKVYGTATRWYEVKPVLEAFLAKLGEA
jgi:P4 family phage/plasmid primase-like protien